MNPICCVQGCREPSENRRDMCYRHQEEALDKSIKHMTAQPSSAATAQPMSAEEWAKATCSNKDHFGRWFTLEQLKITLNAYAAYRESPLLEMLADIKQAWESALNTPGEHVDMPTWIREFGVRRKELAELRQQLAAEDEEIERLRDAVPHPGDGSCDHCGKVPAVDVPTALCDECRDGVKRAEAAEASFAALKASIAEKAQQAAEELGTYRESCIGRAVSVSMLDATVTAILTRIFGDSPPTVCTTNPTAPGQERK